MKLSLVGLAALFFGTCVSSTAAAPVEFFVYSSDHKRQTIVDEVFEVELYQEGNPYPLLQTIDARKRNCELTHGGFALKCTGSAILDLPSKFAPVIGIDTFRIIFKPYNGDFPVLVSNDVVVDFDNDTRSRILVEPFRLVPLRSRVFENAVQKRNFIPYPKSFTTYGIPELVVIAALKETYGELKNVRRVGEYDAFLALVDLWKDYSAVTNNALLSVLQTDVRFEDPNNLQNAIALLESLGLDMPGHPTPVSN